MLNGQYTIDKFCNTCTQKLNILTFFYKKNSNNCEYINYSYKSNKGISKETKKKLNTFNKN